MSHPFFSIIVPVYNVEQYLNRCINSIIEQTFRDFELILVDDGSPDECPIICDEWSKKDNRIIVVHKANGGASDARNAGLNIACGKYILFIDSDDYWCDKCLLQDIYKRSINFQEEIILFGNKIICEDGTEEITRSNYNLALLNQHDKAITLDSLFKENNFPGSAWIYAVSRDLIEKINLRFKLGVTAEDYEWIIATIVASNAIGAIEGVQYAYVRRPGSVTTQCEFSGIQGAKNAFDRYYATNERYRGLDSFVARIYLLALMSYNQLSSPDKIKAKPLLKQYRKLLKDAGQIAFYWFIGMMGLRISSFAIKTAYKIIR